MEFGGAIVLAATLAVVIFGGLVTSVTVRAARRTGAPALWNLAGGLGLIAVGAVVAELLLFDLSARTAVGPVAASVLLAAGFVSLAYSIFGGTS